MSRTAIMWFRRDLRLADNHALAEALGFAGGVVPVAVIEPEGALHAPTASHAWRAGSLAALDASLRERGSRLIVRKGPADVALPRLAAECGAMLVTCSRDCDPPARVEETRVRDALHDAGVELAVAEGSLLAPPGTVATTDGRSYRVFTPFFRAWERAWVPGEPISAPAKIPAPESWPESLPLPAARNVRAGEASALRRLAEFVRGGLADYAETRDRPDLHGTSELSPSLAAGEVSPGQVAVAAIRAVGLEGSRPFLRQLAWREFAYHILDAFPPLATEPWRPEYASMPWRDDDRALDAWKNGGTGYPLVDAGMRQLAETGLMHNRVRLVAASFLCKDLLLPWQEGERFFRDRLADYDPAANAFNWQWVAGSGADAAPYFRVFNPSVQGSRFDPDGTYVRRWLPELAALSSRWIHAPGAAPAEDLARAGLVLGASYPRPIVDHAEARVRALAALETVRVSARAEAVD